jgi:hypothetical protein
MWMIEVLRLLCEWVTYYCYLSDELSCHLSFTWMPMIGGISSYDNYVIKNERKVKD